MSIRKEYRTLSDAVAKEHAQVFKKLDTKQLEDAMEAIIKAPHIFVYAAGREGISLRGFAMRLAHLGKSVSWIFDDTAIGIVPGDLYITSEGSGNVGSFTYYLKKVKAAGGEILTFTGNPDGEHVKRFSDHVVFIRATAFLANRDDVVPTVQMMGNQYEQHLYMLCDIIIMLLTKKLGLSYDDLQAKHRNIE